jgi:hypothetical protein
MTSADGTAPGVPTGESHRPPDGDRVTTELWGAVTAEVTRQLRERLRPGGGNDIVLVGVGHSMGGYAVIAQQAIAGDCDGLAILGTSNDHMEGVYTRSDATPSLEDQQRAQVDQIRAAGAAHDGYLHADRAALRSLFHLPDVPPDVLAADEAKVTCVPVGAAT